MAKQSIFGRISTLMRANINAILDSAEDPQKMLDQLVRDYTNSIADAEAAIAETIGNLRLLERDHQEDVQSAAEWGNKAIAASRKADELRRAGSTADADKFDNLAKIALQRQISDKRMGAMLACGCFWAEPPGAIERGYPTECPFHGDVQVREVNVRLMQGDDGVSEFIASH